MERAQTLVRGGKGVSHCNHSPKRYDGQKAYNAGAQGTFGGSNPGLWYSSRETILTIFPQPKEATNLKFRRRGSSVAGLLFPLDSRVSFALFYTQLNSAGSSGTVKALGSRPNNFDTKASSAPGVILAHETDLHGPLC